MNEDYLIPKKNKKKGILEKSTDGIESFVNHNGLLRKCKNNLEHSGNPMHVYCRIREFLSFLGKYEGFFQDEKRNKKISLTITKKYEKYFYKPIKKLDLKKVL